MESTLSTIIPRKQSPSLLTVTLCYVTLLFADIIQRASVNVNNRRLTEFFDRYFHSPLPIVMKHELGLPFPPKNLRIKFGANLSTFFSYRRHRQTDRHTHKPTPVNTYSLSLG